LESEELEVPSKSFIRKVLGKMPSAKTKECAGVNAVAEDAMEGFSNLRRILDQFKPNIGKNEYQNVVDVLDSLKLYLKSRFSENLSMSSEIASHCVRFMSSSDDDDRFKEVCSHQHFSRRCEHCDQLNDLIEVFIALLEQHVETLDDDIQIDSFWEDTENAFKAIVKYKMEMVKAWLQKMEWQKKFEQLDESQAFFLQDWSMKYFNLLLFPLL
jgi:hypothetical protein